MRKASSCVLGLGGPANAGRCRNRPTGFIGDPGRRPLLSKLSSHDPGSAEAHRRGCFRTKTATRSLATMPPRRRLPVSTGRAMLLCKSPAARWWVTPATRRVSPALPSAHAGSERLRAARHAFEICGAGDSSPGAPLRVPWIHEFAGLRIRGEPRGRREDAGGLENGRGRCEPQAAVAHLLCGERGNGDDGGPALRVDPTAEEDHSSSRAATSRSPSQCSYWSGVSPAVWVWTT